MVRSEKPAPVDRTPRADRLLRIGKDSPRCSLDTFPRGALAPPLQIRVRMEMAADVREASMKKPVLNDEEKIVQREAKDIFRMLKIPDTEEHEQIYIKACLSVVYYSAYNRGLKQRIKHQC